MNIIFYWQVFISSRSVFCFNLLKNLTHFYFSLNEIRLRYLLLIDVNEKEISLSLSSTYVHSLGVSLSTFNEIKAKKTLKRFRLVKYCFFLFKVSKPNRFSIFLLDRVFLVNIIQYLKTHWFVVFRRPI